MERKSFIKSLLTLAAAPKLIAELNIPMKAAPLPVGSTTALFSQLHFVVPDYMPALIAKYGNESYLDFMNHVGNENMFQVAELKDGMFTVRNIERTEMYEPVTFTIPKQP